MLDPARHDQGADPAFKVACQYGLQMLAESCPGLLAASVSSKDGTVLASFGAAEENSKIAVIAGTLLAVSEAVVAEAELQECRNIVIEATRGRVALLALPGTYRDFVLAAIVGPNTSLGMLLGCCRVASESIASTARQDGGWRNGAARNGFEISAG